MSDMLDFFAGVLESHRSEMRDHQMKSECLAKIVNKTLGKDLIHAHRWEIAGSREFGGITFIDVYRCAICNKERTAFNLNDAPKGGIGR